ncbi:MAG: hypothetical protein WC584_05205 [Candidatus Pacearchaeota archaeon]
MITKSNCTYAQKQGRRFCKYRNLGKISISLNFQEIWKGNLR